MSETDLPARAWRVTHRRDSKGVVYHLAGGLWQAPQFSGRFTEDQLEERFGPTVAIEVNDVEALLAEVEQLRSDLSERGLRCLYMSEHVHLAEQDRDAWRTRYEAATVPEAVAVLVADNDRLRAEVKQAWAAERATSMHGLQMWRERSESLAVGARWWWRWGVEVDGKLVVADNPDEPVLWTKAEAEARQLAADTGGRLVRQRRVAYPPEPVEEPSAPEPATGETPCTCGHEFSHTGWWHLAGCPRSKLPRTGEGLADNGEAGDGV